MRDLFLRALNCQEVERPPVWLMRQAGRYLPEYQQLRKTHTLDALFRTPKLAVETTLQPLTRFDLDAAILFSDILMILEVLGLKVIFPDKGGPQVTPLVKTKEDLEKLSLLPQEKVLSYVFETIRLLKGILSVPLIGFSGAPFTLACYAMDRSQNDFAHVHKWMKQDPSSLHRFIDLLTNCVIEYLQHQMDAGVDAIQLFDSCADMITEGEWLEFSFPYLKKIIDAVNIPIILFAKSSSLRVPSMIQLKPRCISFDWHQPIDVLRKRVPSSIAVQGNFIPSLLTHSKDEIETTIQAALDAMRPYSGWIVNLGHGVTPDIPVEHVHHFVLQVQNAYPKFRSTPQKK